MITEKMATAGKRICILLLMGFIASVMLLYHHVEVNSGFQLSGSYCAINETFDCDAVAKSAYSEFFGLIPIASLGMIFYIIWFVMITHLYSKADRDNKGAMLLLSGVGAIVSLIMLCISVFVIRKICINCSFLYIINLIVFGLVLHRVLKTEMSVIACAKNGFIGVWEFLKSAYCRPTEYEKQQGKSAVRAVVLAGVLSLIVIGLPRLVLLPMIEKLNSSRIEKTLSPETMMVLEAWKAEPVKDLHVDVSGFSAIGEMPAIDYFYGSKTAPNTIVVFTDYQCGFCARAVQILKQYVDKNKHKAKLVLKNFPLDNACNRSVVKPFHKKACLLAAVARCAGSYTITYLPQGGFTVNLVEVGKAVDSFWSEYEKITKLSAYEPSPELRKCAETNKFVKAKLFVDMEYGIELGVTATPAIFVNNKALKGLTAANAHSLLNAMFN